MQSDVYTENGFLNETILTIEVEKAINRLKTGKAMGCDFIPNEVLKCKTLLKSLHKLFTL